MAEDKKEAIFGYLKRYSPEKFTLKSLTANLREKYISNISYPTVSKWTAVLEAEGRIKIEDYGNIKLIYIEEIKEVEDGK